MSGQRKALIIANDEYEQEALSNLLAPEADADALGRVLGDAQIGAFSVSVVRNRPSHALLPLLVAGLFTAMKDVMMRRWPTWTAPSNWTPLMPGPTVCAARLTV